MVISFDPKQKPLDGDLLLTMACPVGCDFCIYSCLPSMEPQKWMPEETIRRVAEEYSKNDITIRICGGEPFYNLEKLKRCIDILLEYYQPNELNIISSAIFSGTKENARRNVDVIKNAGMDRLLVSVDRFHLPRVPLTKIKNIIEVCKEHDIDIILRLSMDERSVPLIDKLAEIVVKYQVPIEFHGYSLVGKAETLDTPPLVNLKEVEKILERRIMFYAKKYKFPSDYKYYSSVHSSKRRQRVLASPFFPTTFPNGNVYASDFSYKSEFIGNINNENLVEMIIKLKKTYAGNILLPPSNRFETNRKYVLDKFRDIYDLSRNFPFTEYGPNEAIGRSFIKIDSEDNFEEILEELNKNKTLHGPFGVLDREFLLSLRLKEEDLWNKETEIKIKGFFEKLRENKIRFVLSRPIPPCLKIKTNDNEPKNCYECRELFSVKDGRVVFCDCLKNKKGPEFKHIKNREHIVEIYKQERKKMNISKICLKCIHYSRNRCLGLVLP